MWKIWKGKDQDGQPQATRANLGETQSSMYYDQEKKRWRERGKEHLEEEDPGLKPPPKVDEITKPGGDAPPQAPQPAKPASAADELCAPPPPSYLSNLRKPKATQPPARPQVALGAFGMPPASGEAGNEAHEDNADQGGVKLQANPNAPRAFTGQGMNMKVNPNAPRAFRRDGAAAPKENRQRKGPQAGGRPRQSPYSSAFPAFVPPSGGGDPEGGGGEDGMPESNSTPPLPSPCPPTVPGFPPPSMAVDAEGGSDEAAPDADVHPPHLSPHAPDVPAFISPSAIVDAEGGGSDKGTPDAEGPYAELPPVGVAPLSTTSLSSAPLKEVGDESAALREAEELASRVPEMRVRANPFASAQKSPCSAEHESLSLVGVQPEADETSPAIEATFMRESSCASDQELPADVTQTAVGARQEANEASPVMPEMRVRANPFTSPPQSHSGVTEASLLGARPELVPAGYRGDLSDEGEQEQKAEALPEEGELVEEAEDGEIAEEGEVAEEGELAEEGLVAEDQAADATAATAEEVECHLAAGEVSEEVAAEVERVATVVAAEEDGEIMEEGEFREATAAAEAVSGGIASATMAEEEKGAENFEVENSEVEMVEDAACLAEAPSPQPESEDFTPHPSHLPESEQPEIAKHGVMVNDAADAPLQVAFAGAQEEVEEVPHEDKANVGMTTSWGDMDIDLHDHQESVPHCTSTEASPSEKLPPPAASVRVKNTFIEGFCEEEVEATMGVQSAPASAWQNERAMESSWSMDNGFGGEDVAAEIAIPSTDTASKAAAIDSGESLSSWEIHSEEQRIAAAPNDALRIEVAELRETNAMLERALAESRDLANSRQARLDELLVRCPELERFVQEATDSAEAREEAILAERRRAEDANQQREEALRKAHDVEQRLAAALTARATPCSPAWKQDGEEFSLPDFMWSCDNSEILEFVKKLAADNASLRREMGSVLAGSSLVDSIDGRMSAVANTPLRDSSPFDAAEVDIDRALSFAQSVGERDGHQIPTLVALLRERAANAQLCSQVCTALESLTFTDAEHRRVIMQHGGIEAVLCVMELHQDADPSLLRPAMDALWNLTFDDEVVMRVANAGGIERVLALMRKHDGIAELQGAACAVLLNLASTEANRREIVQGGASLVAAAMRRHSTNEDVLEQGCQTLYMLAHCEHLSPPALMAEAFEAAKLAAVYPHGVGHAQKWGRWLQEVLSC